MDNNEKLVWEYLTKEFGEPDDPDKLEDLRDKVEDEYHPYI